MARCCWRSSFVITDESDSQRWLKWEAPFRMFCSLREEITHLLLSERRTFNHWRSTLRWNVCIVEPDYQLSEQRCNTSRQGRTKVIRVQQRKDQLWSYVTTLIHSNDWIGSNADPEDQLGTFHRDQFINVGVHYYMHYFYSCDPNRTVLFKNHFSSANVKTV